MGAIEITSTVTIDHAKLGAEVWEWDSDKQAEFLAALAKSFNNAGGSAHFQIYHIVEALGREPEDIASVRWLNDLLTDYLKEES